MRLFASSRRKNRSRHSSRSSTYHTSFSNRPCDTVFHTSSPVSHEQIRTTEYPASHALAIPSIKREHTHKVAQLHVDTSETYYLQERNHKERVIGGDIVKHTGNTESHCNNERYSRPCHNRIEHSHDCLFRHVLIAGYHAQKKADRQEHGKDDK